MAGFHNFRSAFYGFNRSDVVNYIEYTNNKHHSEIEQLTTQLQTALAQAKPSPDPELLEKLAAAEERIAELEAALDGKPIIKPDELETYRRAERAERKAEERAAQIYAQANAVLADATVKVEAASNGVATMVQQVSAQLDVSRQQLQEAVDAMYAIRPEE